MLSNGKELDTALRASLNVRNHVVRNAIPGIATARACSHYICYTFSMELTQQQYEHLKDLLPRQRGNVKGDNRPVLAALLYIVEQGCKWRGLPEHFGNWHTLYTRLNRWAKNGVLDRVFAALQQQQIIRVRIEVVSLDSTVIKVHPDGTGARKKTGRKPSGSLAAAGRPRFIWLPRMLAPP